MTHKPFIWIVMIFVLTACGSKNPGMSKEDAAKALVEQATQVQTESEVTTVAVTDFPEGYMPPAGIKYEPKIVTTGAVVLNIQAALKNIRPMKVSELGKMEIHRTGIETITMLSRTGALTSVKEGYLLNAVQGLFLLKKDFQLAKQLFQNEVEISGGDMPFVNPKQMIYDVYYDSSCRQLRCTFIKISAEQDKRKEYVVTLPFDALLDSDTPLKPEVVTSRLPIKLAGNSYAGMKGGFTTSALGMCSIYTFSANGDTLCRFKVGKSSDYESGSIPRTGERGKSYIYQNKTYFRMAYSNVLYHLEDASTLKAVYQLNFGTLKQATKKEVSSNQNINDLYFVEDWLESDRYLFILLAKGYNCPDGRKEGIVSLYTLIYDKHSKVFFSLPPSKNKEVEFPVLKADGAENLSFFPNFVVDGIPVMMLSGKELKKDCNKGLETLGLTDVSDKELFIVTVK